MKTDLPRKNRLRTKTSRGVRNFKQGIFWEMAPRFQIVTGWRMPNEAGGNSEIKLYEPLDTLTVNSKPIGSIKRMAPRV